MSSMRQRHILVVEDDRDLRETMVEALEEEGYSVASANDGLGALAYLRQPTHTPDLILLDLMMPNMNGARFREEQLKTAEYANIPVAVLTADGNGKDRADALKAAGFLRKPMTIASLLELVVRVLRLPPEPLN